MLAKKWRQAATFVAAILIAASAAAQQPKETYRMRI